MIASVPWVASVGRDAAAQPDGYNAYGSGVCVSMCKCKSEAMMFGRVRGWGRMHAITNKLGGLFGTAGWPRWLGRRVHVHGPYRYIVRTALVGCRFVVVVDVVESCSPSPSPSPSHILHPDRHSPILTSRPPLSLQQAVSAECTPG